MTGAAEFAMPFLQALGVELLEAGGGVAALKLTIRPDHLNAFGGVHGGVIAALLDIVVSAAAAIDIDGPGFRPNLTLALTTTHLSPAPGEGALTARAAVRGGGAQIAFVDAEVQTADGTPIATGTATLRYRAG